MNHRLIPRAVGKTGGAVFFRAVYRAAYYTLVLVGVGGLAYAGYVVTDAHIYQANAQLTFDNQIRSDVPKKTTRSQLIVGGAMGEISIPRLGLKTIFVQGDSQKVLKRAVGHMPETALPGELGNVVLTGHRDTFFRPLRNIQKGDEISLKTLDGDFRYEVDSTAVVPPDDIQVLQPSSKRMLTLITCFPFYYVGPAPSRFIVRAREIVPSFE